MKHSQQLPVNALIYAFQKLLLIHRDIVYHPAMHLYVSHFLLRKLREKRKLTQAELAVKVRKRFEGKPGKRAGKVSQSTISHWETGDSVLSPKKSEIICTELDWGPREMGEALYEIACEEFGFDVSQIPQASDPSRQAESYLRKHAAKLSEYKLDHRQALLDVGSTLENAARVLARYLKEDVRAEIAGPPTEPEED